MWHPNRLFHIYIHDERYVVDFEVIRSSSGLRNLDFPVDWINDPVATILVTALLLVNQIYSYVKYD